MKFYPFSSLRRLAPMLFVCSISASVFISCNNNSNNSAATQNDSLTDEQRHLPENALKTLVMADGLEIQPFATEPMLINPTNMDVDEKGRVWITEAFNYRPFNGNAINPNGDRIIILEDTNGDGKADTTKVFYEGPEINAPLGVCVLGNRVLISQSPYVWAFYDDNNDDKADRKEILFQGIGGEQHDHGMHTFTFGPDGKLYFNFGNEGRTLKDKNGKVVLDQDGDEIGPKKYKEGMVFRCNPDGSQVECLGNNFRNNFEVAVDSYGTMWQSDNDDDGNKGVRINYVMDYGNYGYRDEMTGAGWSSSRTNMEDSIPFRHWHLNDPGVVPNLLQTGSGSPTGMVIYEGDLLPEVFRNQMIHCEPGHNVVRSYPVKKNGAGYTAEIVNIAKNEKDQWFRPSDVCVAPDGSLFVSDWYDPGVGGHQMGDNQRGRVYRIAPKGVTYKVPAFDYTTAEGAVKALQNSNLAVRRHAWLALQDMGEKAVPALEVLWNNKDVNARMRARALWALLKQPGGSKYIELAIKSDNPDLRIVGLRAARELNTDVIKNVALLVNDKDVQVRRECAIALRHSKAPEAAGLWAQLAQQYDGKDRWYLEALGIGADRQWDSFFTAYQKTGDPLKSAAGRDIIWRARSKTTLPLLAQLASDNTVAWADRQRYFRAFDFNTDPLKTKLLLEILTANQAKDLKLDVLLLNLLSPEEVKKSPAAAKALQATLGATYGTQDYINLVTRFNSTQEKQRLLKLVIEKPGDDVARDAVKLFINYGGEKELMQKIAGGDTLAANNILRAMGTAGGTSVEMLKTIVTSDDFKQGQRLMAAEQLGKSYVGMMHGVKMLKEGKIAGALAPAFVNGLEPDRTPGNIMDEAKSYLSGGDNKNKQAPVNAQEILAMKGDAAHGAKVFTAQCAICHQVKNEGTDFGPKLSEIGSKLPKEGLLEAIINPSAGISFGFENYEITLKDGNVVSGIISSRSESEIELKYPGGKSDKIKIEQIKSQKKLQESIMPSLGQSMAKQDLADLLAYMTTLTKK